MRVDQVFGISPELRESSYVDRGELDVLLERTLRRTTHVAIRGPSKSGKSWLRQKVLDNPIVVQCRLRKPFTDIYVDALSQLGIRLVVKETRTGSFKAQLSATAKFGTELLAKVGLASQIEGSSSHQAEVRRVGQDIDDLRYVAEIIKESGKNLVVEDFHYMSTEDRRGFAFDMKTLWDYGLFVVIIGVWSETNLLLHLNPDLAGRVVEISVDWSPKDLERILTKGGQALQVVFSPEASARLVGLAYSNAGVLQQLTLLALDDAGIHERKNIQKQSLEGVKHVDNAAMEYAEQLNPVYQQFSRLVSSGIRSRKNATGIYAHAMAVIIDATDVSLVNGLSAKEIFDQAYQRQPRIQLSNLKAILEKIPELQVDEDGRGLVLTYNTATEEVSVVDRQLLLYRRYATVKWPWENMIIEADEAGGEVEVG
ncbi:MAG: hypothetical protein RBS57_20140 [Desulforhabdus sp.]|nr:hypothetical protein [Desulforhabdus sp.]